MSTIRDILIKKRQSESKFAIETEVWRGTIKAVERGDGTLSIYVEDRPGFVWIESQNGGAVAVFNSKVRALPNMSVLVGRAPRPPYRWEVLQWDDSLIILDDNYNSQTYLGRHHSEHEAGDGWYGGDSIDVYNRMLVALKTWVSEDANESNPTTEIGVSSLLWVDQNTFIGFNGIDSFDLTPYLATAGNKRWILIFLDKTTGAIAAKAGTEVPNTPTSYAPFPTIERESITSALILSDNVLGIWNEKIIDARTLLGSDGNGLPAAEEIGQILYSVDGLSFAPYLPLSTPTGIVVDDNTGVIIVADKYGA